MAVGSGLAAQLGVAKETTYGTRVAPAKFYEFNSESLAQERNRLFSQGLRAGRLFQSSTRVHTVTRQSAGDINLEVPNQGFSTLVDLLHGMTPTVVAAGTAWLHTHQIGVSDPSKSATLQVGTPGTDGTVRTFEYVGAMCTSFKFECKTGGFLETSFSFDAQDRTTSQTLGSATYPTNLRTYHFAQCTPTVNSVAITDVFDSVTITGTLNRKTDRFKLGTGGLKAKPILNDMYDIEVEFGGDFKDLTYTALFDADTIVPVDVKFLGTTAVGGGANFEYVDFTFANCVPIIDDPDVSGPDVLTQGLKFKAVDSGTGFPMVYTSVTIDAAI